MRCRVTADSIGANGNAIVWTAVARALLTKISISRGPPRSGFAMGRFSAADMPGGSPHGFNLMLRGRPGA